MEPIDLKIKKFAEIKDTKEFKNLLKKEKKIKVDFHGNRDLYNFIKGIAREIRRLDENGSGEGMDHNRVVLIVCKSIKIANKINDEFIHRNANLKIHMLTNAEQSKQLELYDNMKPCNIIIATNLAGRGTDINLSKEVINNRGLHVCLTFIPRNERVEEQAFGRAGRKGEPGTYQLICNFFEEITNFTGILFTGNLPKQIQNIFLIQSDLDSKLGKILFPCFVIKEEDLDKNQNSDNNNKENIKNSIIKLNDFIKKELKDLPMNYEKLIKERDLKEEKELNKVNQEIDKIKLKDNLFNHYLKFIKEKNLKPNELIFKDIEEQWGLWLNKITNQEVYLFFCWIFR
jgi:superfamily II DNA/RNA helicase